MAAKPVDGVTVVRRERWERALVWVGLPLAGAVLGWLVWALAGWVASLRGLPMRGPFKAIDALPEPAALLGCLAVGVVLGAVFAAVAESEYVTVAVSDDEVVCTRGGDSQTVPRAEVSGVFVDDGRLVLLGHEAQELAVHSAREGADLPPTGRLADAFTAHGYPWLPGGDPYQDRYRRWVPDMPGLPLGADALLRARDRALSSGDKEESAQLRGELGRLGVVVREDGKKRQFWRTTRQSLDPQDR
ncbi:hypothetical protein SAMN04489712_110168 [Thermomonospora echinospora]|uniref:Uncharacterized protein n=1 Tax=Thermomonospora echinospora TaxID=1992 RepID=A0A1H6CMQ0_9ACTN|nr:hypothetical protein [Thermomonospora echinospora]SEG73905.1 hypothetical protein SAMN04489712_110168 [Thermomonospora echinospora]